MWSIAKGAEQMTHYFAYLGIERIGDPAQTAMLVGEALDLDFLEDLAGRFEYPAFIAEKDGVEYALLGVPPAAGDVRDQARLDYALQVRSLHSAPNAEKVDISVELVSELTHGGVFSWGLPTSAGS